MLSSDGKLEADATTLCSSLRSTNDGTDSDDVDTAVTIALNPSHIGTVEAMSTNSSSLVKAGGNGRELDEELPSPTEPPPFGTLLSLRTGPRDAEEDERAAELCPVVEVCDTLDEDGVMIVLSASNGGRLCEDTPAASSGLIVA
jgi:hypothetical protein